MPHRRLELPRKKERGVWMLPWPTAAGERIIYAVDSHGVIIDERRAVTYGDVTEAEAYLWRLLDYRDPVGSATRTGGLRLS
jgi:hypothetical protein